MTSTSKYLFGPVHSRRLGLSLGVDLTPSKTCSLNCVFCQIGNTDCLTVERKEYVPVNDVKNELKQWKRDGRKTDFITLSGAGEPTLHLQFGEVLRFIEEYMEFPSVLLSNGTLFYLPEVREASLAATIVKVSLSAWDDKSFALINRPHPSLQLQKIIDGYRIFRNMYRGKLWIEVFLVPGLNTHADDIRKIASLVQSISPDAIHLNTAIRPSTEKSVMQVHQSTMEQLAKLFSPPAHVISATSPQKTEKSAEVDEPAILNMLLRHPCTARQIAAIFGLQIDTILEYLKNLLATQQIKAHKAGNETYYVVEQKIQDEQNS